MTDPELLLLKRLKNSQDGMDFIELLKDLSQRNYKEWKKVTGDALSVCQGYAICIDSILNSFEQCEQIIEKRREAEAELNRDLSGEHL